MSEVMTLEPTADMEAGTVIEEASPEEVDHTFEGILNASGLKLVNPDEVAEEAAQTTGNTTENTGAQEDSEDSKSPVAKFNSFI
ncbi:MAG TPA: hypothetical protein VLF60_03660 [Candidatus Saccharimonadales bacterium]|nr:hypothetical protein [Candidatus Saccharimonadales bacterium]